MQRASVSWTWMWVGWALSACSGGAGASGDSVVTTTHEAPANADDAQDAGAPVSAEPEDASAQVGELPEPPAPPDPDAFEPTLPPILPGTPIVAETNTWTWVKV